MSLPTSSSLPEHWVGWWTAPDGRSVLLERDGGGWLVTVAAERGGEPYRSAEPLVGPAFLIARRPAEVRRDDQGRYREIEAGTEGVGPTYRLYPGVHTVDGRRRPAEDDAERTALILIPDVGLGLYDDFDDDLGVPWAYPLQPLAWSGPDRAF